MEEKKITKKEFDEAVEKTIHAVSHEVDGPVAKLVVPLTGVVFAKKMKEYLFKEDK